MMKVLLVLFLGAVIVVTVAQTASENSTSDEDNTEVIDKCEYPAACDNCAQQVENVRRRDIYQHKYLHYLHTAGYCLLHRPDPLSRVCGSTHLCLQVSCRYIVITALYKLTHGIYNIYNIMHYELSFMMTQY